MANILLGVTGSVAAIRTPELFRALRQAHHHVKIVATHAATYFFNVGLIDPVHPEAPVRNHDIVYLDEDEWPGRSRGHHYQRDDAVLHIELRRWADLLLIAPLDANTLGKLAGGLCDNCLTCVYRAWELDRPIVLAPAMNTHMWYHPATARHLRQLAQDAGCNPPAHLKHDDLPLWINAHCHKLRIVGPESKGLACGDVGMGAMASIEQLVAMVTATV
jgi:phosphopantothenoylcysteine decarboxylase